MATKLEHKILLWASNAQIDYNMNRGPPITRKLFNDEVKQILGKEAYQVTLRLWKEGYIKVGYLGLVTISGKGCLKATEDVEDNALS